jgi:uncharacterized protein YydD (DUF2326 family)
MLQIRKLYTEPALIDPVEFFNGLNCIFGEKDDYSSKNNGVGKSLCIEFIDYALLKQKSHSRVAKIPKETFPSDTKICLDLLIDGVKCTIKRSIAESENPLIIFDDREIRFSKIEDATSFLTEKLFGGVELDRPNYREVLAPIIRDEKSEFKSLTGCFDTDLKIPDNYAPHLYFLGIKVSLYKAVKDNIKELDDLTSEIKRIEENVLLLRRKEVADARSDMNELDSEVAMISSSIEKLENTAGFELVRDDLLRLEEEIEAFRRQKVIIKNSLSKLKPVSEKVEIESDEIRDFYNQLKVGLGDLISKDLDEVLGFKRKIEQFQNHLLGERKETLSSELKFVNDNLRLLDKQYSDSLKILDKEGSLKSLKQTYSAFQAKSDELGQLRSFIVRYDDLIVQKQRAKSEKESKLLELQGSITTARETIKSFEQTILSIHEFIQGNRKASFDIKPTSKKQVVEIIMRIDDDGSHSVDREKVFIYDFSLLTNPLTAQRHPGMLIHDNIFEVDQDTLGNSLKYLVEVAQLSDNQQYILTLNSDRLESFQDEGWYDALDAAVRARFTKAHRFLKVQYQQVGKS